MMKILVVDDIDVLIDLLRTLTNNCHLLLHKIN